MTTFVHESCSIYGIHFANKYNEDKCNNKDNDDDDSDNDDD